MSGPATHFNEDAQRKAGYLRHRGIIQTAMGKYEVVRDQRKLWFQDWQGARNLAARTKFEAVNHLDTHLAEFAQLLESRGTKVHWASNAEQARNIILGILREKQAKVIVKSKAMTSEEIHLNDAPSDDPEVLTMVARRALRKKYLQADVGITGANFAIAETGMISITENEGNARLTAALPKTMITLVGIEKILPRLEDLALFLPMLAVMGTGQALTCYNTMYGGPRQPGEADGPEEYHVVLLDNQRTLLLADAEQRDALGCIRCGACLNVCPIFRNIGGHTYGTVYGGPIGSVITPHLRGLQDWKHLSYASSLCGACTETCPVKIDLHHHLLQNLRNASAPKTGKPIWWQKIAFKLFTPVANTPVLWSLTTKLGRFGQIFHGLVKGGALDPAQAWTRTREVQPIAKQSFREWWKEQDNAKHR